MIFDKRPDKISKWNKGFWARGYYVATVGNLTEDAIKKISKDNRKRIDKKDCEGISWQPL
jgi:putative transposase